MMRTHVVIALVWLVVGLGAGSALGGVAGCSPSDRATVRPFVEPVTDLGCVVLRALTTSGTVDEVCARAEELAPYVADILASRAESPVQPRATMVAFTVPTSPRRVPRRRCVSWVPIASLKDAGEAGAP
jgi:hypothetical protein